jgi:aminopeptidase N
MQEFIGDPKLYQECLKVYLQKFAYKNAKTEDFLKVMNEVSGKKLDEVFTPWLTQPCFPQLTVIR